MLLLDVVKRIVFIIIGLLPTDVIMLKLNELVFDDTFNTILSFVNYFLPIHWCVTLFNAWLGVILLMFIIKFIIKNMNFIKFDK